MMVVPVSYASDRQVQRYVKVETLDFDDPKSPQDLIQAALARYGHRRCYDLGFWIH